MKKIIFGFLVICNLVLLAVSLFFGVTNRIKINNFSRDAVTLMEKNDVSVESGVYQDLTEKRQAYTLKTDNGRRDSFCKQLLGKDAEAEAQSGGSVMWSGEDGSLTWSTNGTLTGSVSFHKYTDESQMKKAVRHIRRLMKKSGVDMKNAEVEGDTQASTIIVTAKQSVDGMEITDCELKFTFDSEGTAAVSGRWCFGKPEKVVMDELKNCSPVDILLAVARANSEVTEINSVTPVYYLSSKSGGRFTLVPCWKAETDRGDIIIDPTTKAEAGKTENTADNVYPDGLYGDTEYPTDGNIPNDGTGYPTDGTESEITDPTINEGTIIDDGTGNDIAESPVGDDSTWNPEIGTDKTDPEVPDENGVYG